MTNRYDAVMQRLRAGGRILLDGGTGTELERRGVPVLPDAWSGGGAMTHPGVVREVHEDYISAGASIVISNTFGTSLHALADAGWAEQFEELNRRGVQLACEARMNAGDGDVLVAGGITHWSWTDRHPPLHDLRESVSAQAAVMAAAGADLVMLEMMADVDRFLAVLEGARRSGLPVWVGFSCELDEHGVVRLLHGPTLAEGLQAAAGMDVPVASVMHTEVDDVDACLDVAQTEWSGPLGVYAHSGDFIDGRWVFDGVISPEQYAAAAARWRDRGVQVLGGCCGTTPDHIRAVADIGAWEETR